MRKPKQLAGVKKESFVSQLPDMCSEDKNLTELEQLPPIQKMGKDHYIINMQARVWWG